jgi:hypothetical protein
MKVQISWCWNASLFPDKVTMLLTWNETFLYVRLFDLDREGELLRH